MKRLAVIPLVGAAVAVGVTLWISGLVHPILHTAWSVIAPRPDTAETEADSI